MDCFDKTATFHAIAQRMIDTSGHKKPVKLSVQPHPFIEKSLEMFQSFQEAKRKVEKIESMSKVNENMSYSLFNEATSGEEITQKVNEVTMEIHQLQGSLESLNDYANDLLSIRQNNNKDCKTFVHSIKNTLEIKLSKLASKFREVLKSRANAIKKRQSTMTLNKKASAMPTGNVLRFRAARQATPGFEEASNTIAVEEEQMQTQAQAQAHENTNLTNYRNRLTSVRQIEQTIGELQTVFRQVASLISEQDELVTIIDENTATAEVNVESAHNIFVKEYEILKKNRGFIIKLLAVIFILVVIFVVFFV